MKFDSISENENLYCLQLNLIQLNSAIGGKGVVQPWYDFLEEMDFDDGDEISIYYRYYEKIWDIIIRREEDWEDTNNNQTTFSSNKLC